MRVHVVTALALTLYSAPATLACLWAIEHRSLRTGAGVAATAMVVAFLTASVARTWRRFLAVQYPQYLVGVTFLSYTFAYGMPPGRTLAAIMIGASAEETRGFLSLPQGRALLLLLLVWSVCYLTLAALASGGAIFNKDRAVVRRSLMAVCLTLVVIAATDSSQLIDGLGLEPIVGSLMFLSGDLPRADRAMHGGELIDKIPYGAYLRTGEEVHILVIGEAARRDSWSVYGYDRVTTPNLSALGDAIVWLKHATADANLTELAVPILLTGISPDKIVTTAITGNLFDLAKEAGYRTAWLVNQDITVSNIVGVKPDFLEFPPDFRSNINGRHVLDEALLPALSRELAKNGSARFIGIHSMGSHWEYYNRYPASFQRFGSEASVKKISMISIFASGKDGDATVVDTYDNSVLYTDWFLSQVIHAAQGLQVPATVTYFPDHGEDLRLLDGDAGHGAPNYTRHAFEIPAFIWINSAYRQRHPNNVDALLANSAKHIRSHDLFNSLGQLMGIDWPRSVFRRSFISSEFEPDETSKYLAGGKLVDADPAR